jgi:acyl carrier protein
MELNEIREVARRIILEIITSNNGTDENPVKFGDEDSLIDGGIIDSIGAVQLIEECIQTFNVLIHPAELSLENFDTVNRICEFIQSKLMENQQWT